MKVNRRLLAALFTSVVLLVTGLQAAPVAQAAEPLATVTGTVSISTGPVVQAWVCVADTYNCNQTDDHGTYALSVEPGTFRMSATKSEEDFTMRGQSAELTAVDGGSYTADIRLSEGVGLAGKVILPGNPTGYGQVRLYSVNDDGDLEHYSFDSHDLSYYDGAYSFRALNPGRYVVKVTFEGYAPACAGGLACNPVEVVAGKVTQLSDLTLTKLAPGGVTGLALNAAGAPVAGVLVTAKHNPLVVTATTGADGAFTLGGLDSGLEWDIQLTKSGYASVDRSVYPKPGRTVSLDTVRMLGAGSVSGRILDPDGVGVVGAWVNISGIGYYQVKTDATGAYSIGGVAPGRYRLSAYTQSGDLLPAFFPGVRNSWDATTILVHESQAVESVQLTLIEGSTISGALADAAGDSLTGTLTLFDQAGNEVSTDTWSSEFSFDHLWPGTYTVRATAYRHTTTWLGDKTSMSQADWIHLNASESLDGYVITAPLLPGGAVSGTVHDDADAPANGYRLELGNEEAFVNSDGIFSFDYVTKGTKKLSVWATSDSVADAQICGPSMTVVCSPATVAVGASGTSGVTVTLPKLGSLAGSITGPGTAPLEGFSLEVSDAKGEWVASGSVDPGATSYTIPRLPLGTYTLEASADGMADFRESVVVAGAATKDVVLTAEQASTRHAISGAITLNQSVDYFYVEAIDPTTGGAVGEFDADQSGPGEVPYTLTDVPPGDYVIYAEGAGGRKLWYPEANNPLSATKIHVSDADVTGIDLTLPDPPRQPRLTGRVILPTGVTASDSEDYPSLVVAGLDGDFLYGDDDESIISDDGSFALSLPQGRYRITAGQSATLGTIGLSEDFEITSDLTRDLYLTRGGSLSGHLVGADGFGVEGAVTATTVSGIETWADTDEWGYWMISGAPAGVVSLAATSRDFQDYTAPATYTVVAGHTVNTGTQTLTPAGRLKVEASSISADVEVVVTDLAGTELKRAELWGDDEGEVITGLPVGEVLVRFEGAQLVTEWWRDAATMASATPVTLVANQLTVLVPELTRATTPNGTVTGKVTNTSGYAGKPIVSVTSEDGDEVFGAVADDGSYTLHLAPGVYRLRGLVCGGYWMGQSGCMGDKVTAWYGGASIKDAAPLTVTSGGTLPGVNVVVGPVVPFTTVPAPTIAGTPDVGSKLSAGITGWNPVPELLLYRWKADGVTIAGATGRTHVIGAGESGKSITVTVTGMKDGYQPATGTSAAVGPVGNVVLTGTTPTISGGAHLGGVLTAIVGSWAPVVPTLQWKRDGVVVGSGSTYQVQLADCGASLTVTATATSPGSADLVKVSAATAVPLATFAASAPWLSGSATLGSTLTANLGTWPDGTQLRLQWNRAGSPVAGRTGSAYLIGLDDLGRPLTVTVTASRAHYASATRVSAALTPNQLVMTATPAPKIKGTAKPGKKLTASAGTWGPAPVTLAYRWLRAGSAIPGATGTSYKVQPADGGSRITVQVTGAKAGYASVVKASASTKTVPLSKLKASTPKVTGRPVVGASLTASTGKWTAGTTFVYQWLRSGRAVAGATSASYVLTAADLGKTIKVKVTGIKQGYKTLAKTSKATKKVK